MRTVGRQHVQSVDLVVECDLPLDGEPVDEVVHRFGSSVVHGLKARHGGSVGGRTDTPAADVKPPRRSSILTRWDEVEYLDFIEA